MIFKPKGYPKSADVDDHIINPKLYDGWVPGMKSDDMVDLAMLDQTEVVAMCGYRWVPKRSQEHKSMCTKCLRASMKEIDRSEV